MTTLTKLSSIISPSFFDVHKCVRQHSYTHYILGGGRGSAKSSFVSIEIPLLIAINKDYNAAVFRKVARTMRNTVYEQYAWGIEMLGLSGKFDFRISPMEMIYRPTGQKIMFFGIDDGAKIKSIKARSGYIAITHFEEADQFSGMEEIRKVLQSTMRGGNKFYNFMSYNPPRSRDNWINKEILISRKDRLIHQSTYLDVPREWLGDAFFDEAEFLKEIDPKAYEHEYLGVPVGTGGNVFDNVTIREITEHEIKEYDNIHYGIDWGWYPDPTAYIAVHWQPNQRRLFLFDEFHGCKLSNADISKNLTVHGVEYYKDLIIADNSDKKSIADLRSEGFNIRKTEKGKGSRDYSFKWLASLREIVIDPKRCPLAAEEFLSYEYETTKDGEIISGFPDGNDHSIDATRYALNPVWRRRGE